MMVFHYLLVVVVVISSLLLTAVVLMQKPKSHGMGMAFGAGMGESLFGSQVGNVLTRATIILAVIFMLSTALLTFTGRRSSGGDPVTNLVTAPRDPAAAPADGSGQSPSPAAPIAETVPVPDVSVPEVPSTPATPVTVDPALTVTPVPEGAAPAPAPEPVPAPEVPAAK